MEVRDLLSIDLKDTDLVLLDLDNTLYEYHRCHNIAMEKLLEAMNEILETDPTEGKKLYKEGRSQTHIRYHGTAASHSRLFYIQDLVERKMSNTSIDKIIQLERTYWASFIESMQLFEDALPFLSTCQEMTIPVVLVTDMTAEIQFKKIKHLNILNYLQFIVTSEEAGIEKPHPFIFEYAINKVLRIGKRINKIVVAGDDRKKDNFSSDAYTVKNYHIIRNE